MTNRFTCHAIRGSAICLFALLSIQAMAAEPPAPREVSGEEVDKAVDLAVAYLKSQQKEDGHINDVGSNDTTMTSLSLMALASVGNQPTDHMPAGDVMRKALNYVLTDERQEANGYFGQRDGSRMYGHGITTLMLSEMLGMGVDDAQDQRIRSRVQKAVDLILRAQQVKKNPRETGGWRYNPDAQDSDLSVSVWQLMALRSAKNAGINVPAAAIQDAVDYLKRSNTRDRNSRARVEEISKSGFSYQPGSRDATYTMTSAGLLAMQVCGQYEATEVKEAAQWLADRKMDFKERFFFYGTYYYAQGMYQRGGQEASKARAAVESILLARQRPDGSWQSEDGQERGAGCVYSTSLAILSLSVKYHFLPIYQR